MVLKSIVQGNLEFGKKSTYETVVKMLTSRLETFYKNEILFQLEETMNPETHNLILGRLIDNPEAKFYNNTIALLEYASQYAIGGYVSAWLIKDRKVIESSHIEPSSEKVVVQSFLKGRELVKKKGKEEEALKLLTKAISQFERHALAYERRGQVYFNLGRFKEAIADFNTSIELDPDYTYAYFSRAKMHMYGKKWELAINDFEQANKNSVALQDVHWECRRLLSKCYVEVNDLKKAAFNLKLFANRKFEKSSVNYPFTQEVMVSYADVLTQMELFSEAIEYIERAIKLEPPTKKATVKMDKMLTMRGKIRHLAGSQGFQSDWKKAADLGSKEAKKLLLQHAAK